jgi:hypothetical protein
VFRILIVCGYICLVPHIMPPTLHQRQDEPTAYGVASPTHQSSNVRLIWFIGFVPPQTRCVLRDSLRLEKCHVTMTSRSLSYSLYRCYYISYQLHFQQHTSFSKLSLICHIIQSDVLIVDLPISHHEYDVREPISVFVV